MNGYLATFAGIVFVISSLPGLCQRPDMKFKALSTNEGLSNSYVSTIVQDHLGYMWFGTLDGLNKFDGYEFTVYRHNALDSFSLPHSEIRKVVEDSSGALWIATNSGIARYDRNNDRFVRFPELGGLYFRDLYLDRERRLWALHNDFLIQYDPVRDTFAVHDTIPSGEYLERIYQDTKGTIWIATYDHMYVYDDQNSRFLLQPNLKVKDARVIYEDHEGILWIGSRSEGLMAYHRETKALEKYLSDPEDPGSISKNAVMSVFEDSENNLWIGTMNGGINLLDARRKNFHHYVHDKGDPHSLSFNTVSCFAVDKNGQVWAGTDKGGVNYIEERNFSHFAANAYDKSSLSNDHVTAMFQDSRGVIWIGTDGGGLNKFDYAKRKFTHYLHDPKNPKGLSSNVVLRIMEDSDGYVWLGYWEGGISRYDHVKDEFQTFMISDYKSDPEWRDDCILHLFEDSENNFWVATHKELTLFDTESLTVMPYEIPDGNMQNYVVCSLEDQDGNLWIGSWDGLFLMDKKTKKRQWYAHRENDDSSISSNRIHYIFEDSKGRVWLGTSNGLNLMNKEDMTFSAFHTEDGLPSETIYSILEDAEGNLWLGTNNGLSKFDPDTGVFRNFNVHDGLQGNEFKPQSCLRLASGELLFGGANGFNLFDPAQIQENLHVPAVVFTDFMIFNEQVPVGSEDSPLEAHISQVSQVTLPYKSSVFTIGFAALNYVSPEKNQYSYFLEGFDKAWTNPSTNRAVTYTNLDPGTYTFRVKASNNDGLWNEQGASLVIVIAPPFYMTWWFRIMVGAGLVLSAWFIVKSNITRQQREKLEKLVDERTESLNQANVEIRGLYSEIKESIRAAEAIQQSILPPEDLLKRYFPESFVINKPKDIIGGDFYWLTQVDGKLVIAAIDCTGHGVSGALVSIKSFDLLKQVVLIEKTVEPADILARLNELMIHEFFQMHDDSFIDGMDISLCVMNPDKSALKFVGANSPLYQVRDGILQEFKPDNLPIGMSFHHKKERTFFSNEVELRPGDMLYLFSDGYADQIGGDSGGEKFKYPRFRRILAEISKENPERQCEILKHELAQWQASMPQLDDILVIGLRV